MLKLNQNYLLLIRHGSVDREDEKKKDEEQGLNSSGLKSANETASALGEQLKIEQIDHVKIWSSEYRHAIEHSEAVKKALVKWGITANSSPKEKLNPSVFRQGKKENVMEVINEIKDTFKITRKNEALLIVGHQPQLGWLCEQIHRPVAIARSEIVCIRLSTRYIWNNLKWNRSDLLWSITPTNNKTLKQLREKIKSKMDTAKLLGTFILFLLGIVLGILSDSEKLKFLVASDTPIRYIFGWFSGIKYPFKLNNIYLTMTVTSVVFLFLALIFYLFSMYAYDRLLMPVRFWAEGLKKISPRWLPQMPPSSSLLILQVNMIRIWQLLFKPATFFVVLSMIGFAFVVIHADPLEFIIGLVVLGLCVFFYYRFARPRLGAED